MHLESPTACAARAFFVNISQRNLRFCPEWGNAVKHFVAERREPSGELMPQTHRRACALPLQRPRFEGEKYFTALPWADMLMALWAESHVNVTPRSSVISAFNLAFARASEFPFS